MSAHLNQRTPADYPAHYKTTSPHRVIQRPLFQIMDRKKKFPPKIRVTRHASLAIFPKNFGRQTLTLVLNPIRKSRHHGHRRKRWRQRHHLVAGDGGRQVCAEALPPRELRGHHRGARVRPRRGRGDVPRRPRARLRVPVPWEFLGGAGGWGRHGGVPPSPGHLPAGHRVIIPRQRRWICCLS